MMRLLVSLAISAAISGCAVAQDIDNLDKGFTDKSNGGGLLPKEIFHKKVWIDENFNDEAVADIKLAMSAWEDAIPNGAVKFEFIGTFPHDPNFDIDTVHNDLSLREVRIHVQGDEGPSFIHRPIEVLALGKYNAIVVDSHRLYTMTQFKGVMMHELGHSLMMAHIVNESAIMNPSCDGMCETAPTISKFDVDEFCAFADCGK